SESIAGPEAPSPAFRSSLNSFPFRFRCARSRLNFAVTAWRPTELEELFSTAPEWVLPFALLLNVRGPEQRGTGQFVKIEGATARQCLPTTNKSQPTNHPPKSDLRCAARLTGRRSPRCTATLQADLKGQPALIGVALSDFLHGFRRQSSRSTPNHLSPSSR
ncbi:hypothetical protein Csa_023612, partial [Cucumis sativus]